MQAAGVPARGLGVEVELLHERHRQAGLAQVVRRRGAGDAPAGHHDVALGAYVGTGEVGTDRSVAGVKLNPLHSL